MQLEEERKYEAGEGFTMPDLTDCVPDQGRVVVRKPRTLTATYYDTEDLRLARAGASLRHRRGDRLPWTVKLPTEVSGIRQEITRSGPVDAPPADLVGLVTTISLGAPLRPVLTVRTRRTRYLLRDPGGALLAEVADDSVTAVAPERDSQPALRFREIEVERSGGNRRLLDRVEAALTAAGAVAGQFVPKHVRGLGQAASRPADGFPPPAPLPRTPRGEDVVCRAIRASVERIMSNDPWIRLREGLPDGDTPVHQMRVGCRRLRSDLRTFRPLLEQEWAAPLREELRWLAGVLGAARDVEVLRARLRRVANADPLAPLSAAAVERIDADLAARQHEAWEALDLALQSNRYHTLLRSLLDAAAAPRLTALAAASAREVLPELVSQPWHRLAEGSQSVPGARVLAPAAPDGHWHAVRIHGKRVRYAVEAVAEAIGDPVPRLARRLAKLQNLLGEHQDAAIAGQTWLEVAASDPDDQSLAITAGRLFERERAAIREVRVAFPAAWKATDKRSLWSWLPESS